MHCNTSPKQAGFADLKISEVDFFLGDVEGPPFHVHLKPRDRSLAGAPQCFGSEILGL